MPSNQNACGNVENEQPIRLEDYHKLGHLYKGISIYKIKPATNEESHDALQ